MNISPKHLAKVVRQNYPSGLWVDDPQYRKSEEFSRQILKRDEAENNNQEWLKLLHELGSVLTECSFTDKTMFRYDCSYRVQIAPRTYSSGPVMVCVSVLAPVYFIYSLPVDVPAISKEQMSFDPKPDQVNIYDTAANGVEKIFKYERLPVEIALTTIPDVQVGNFALGEVTYFDCLFSTSVD